jgi:hypothetical protein
LFFPEECATRTSIASGETVDKADYIVSSFFVHGRPSLKLSVVPVFEVASALV